MPEAEETTSFGHPTFRVGKKTFAVLDEYIGKHGWTSLRLDGTPLEWREVEELVRESYRLIMPKRQKRTLDVEPERTRRK